MTMLTPAPSNGNGNGKQHKIAPKGKGYTTRQVVEVRTTRQEDIPEEFHDTYPSISTKAEHLRKAFAIVGCLVGDGLIDFNFTDKGWADSWEYTVLSVARTLDEYS